MGDRRKTRELYLVFTPSNIPVSMKQGQTQVVCTLVQPSAYSSITSASCVPTAPNLEAEQSIIPLIPNSPAPDAMVMMCPWFLEIISGTNALIVWEGGWRRGKNRQQSTCFTSASTDLHFCFGAISAFSFGVLSLNSEQLQECELGSKQQNNGKCSYGQCLDNTNCSTLT